MIQLHLLSQSIINVFHFFLALSLSLHMYACNIRRRMPVPRGSSFYKSPQKASFLVRACWLHYATRHAPHATCTSSLRSPAVSSNWIHAYTLHIRAIHIPSKGNQLIMCIRPEISISLQHIARAKLSPHAFAFRDK